VVERLLHTQEVAGSNPASRMFYPTSPMFYTYVLKCGDGGLYVGSALDLRKRLAQHRAGRVRATAHRLPVTLEYYEACRSELKARLREKQLKTEFGRAYLKRRLQ
jgi:putative endonuclease